MDTNTILKLHPLRHFILYAKGHVVLGLIIVVAIVVMEGLGMFFSWLY